MFCLQKYTRHLLRLTLSPQDLQQSLSLETNPVCNAVPCFPHDNIDDGHLSDECMKSTLRVVYHMLESILWLILPICSRTTRCQVVQFVPNTSISRQFVSKLLKILQLIPITPVWTDGRPNKDEKLCKVPPLSCLPVHSVTQNIFEHVLPCRLTTLRFVCEVFAIPVIFCCSAETRDSNIFVYCSIIVWFGLHSRWVHPKYTWLRNDVGSSISTFFITLFHIGATFCFFPAILMSSHKNWPALFTMNEHTLPVRNILPAMFWWSLLEFSFPQQSRQWMAVQISFKTYDWVFNFLTWFWPFVSWKTYPNFWTFWLRNLEEFWSILQFYLGVGRHCISCLSFATWQSCNNIHDLCSSHLWCRWALFSEDCVGSRIVLYNLSSEGSSSAFFQGGLCPSMKQSELWFCLFVIPE